MEGLELEVGQEIRGEPLVVRGCEMRIFSLLMADPNPLHFDPAAVQARGLGDKPINQGTINMAYVINPLLQLVQSPERLESFRCRFLANVLEGDTVCARGRVTHVGSESVTLDIWLERVGGEHVVEGTATLVVGRVVNDPR